jgi:co-chaperonin GroES (HSP10)
MKILKDYIVVKKIPISDTIFADDRFNDDYQRCEVFSVHHESKYMATDEVLVGENIFFDKAKDFGDDTYYIYEDDIFGVIRGGVIIPRNDILYIEAESGKHSKIEGTEFYKDISYDPLKKGNVCQDGTVLSVCDKAKHSMFEYDLNVEVYPGDHVYTHHFLTDPAFEREFNGKKYYEIKYEDVYCKVNDGEIEMTNDWNFVTPIENEIKSTESGILLETTAKKEVRTAIMQHPCKSSGLLPGDFVLFRTGREYEIDVEGHTYYRITKKDILYNLNQMKALGDIVVVKPLLEDNTIGNIVVSTQIDKAPDRGTVVATAENNNDMKEGDEILFRKMASTEVNIEGEKLLLVSTKNIYVVV